MDTKNSTELYNKLTQLIDAGDEKVVRAFMIEHLNEFPEEVKKTIIFEFFAESLDKENKALNQKVQIQKEGMNAIKQIEKAIKYLNEQQKIIDTRISLSNNSN